MRMTVIGAAVGILTAADGNYGSGQVLQCGENLIVRVPRVPLNSGERVAGIELTIRGGSVIRVDGIPRDWGVSVEPEVGGVASVRGSPAHGGGALMSTDALPSVIVGGSRAPAQNRPSP